MTHVSVLSLAYRAWPLLVLILVLTGPAGVRAQATVAESAEAPTDTQVADTVVIATGVWLPYVRSDDCQPAGASGDCSKRFSGPLVDVVRQAFGGAGIKVEFVSHPWTRNAQMIESGAVDAGLPFYCSEERGKQFICSDPVVGGEMVLFHRRGDGFDWETLDDLKSYTIGATLGYFYGDAFQNREADGSLKVLRVAEDEANIRLLMRGLIDLFPQDKAVGYAMARRILPQEQWGEITHHARPLHTRTLHLIFTRANPRGARLNELFNRRLAEMRQAGDLEQLVKPLVQPGTALLPQP